MHKKWIRHMLILLCVLMCVAWATSCGDDDDDDNNDDNDEEDDDRQAPVQCGDGLGDMTCLEYCICLRSACLESFNESECNDEMCKCADQFGCLYDSVVDSYECYL